MPHAISQNKAWKEGNRIAWFLTGDSIWESSLANPREISEETAVRGFGFERERGAPKNKSVFFLN
jgi:hypothetical protein